MTRNPEATSEPELGPVAATLIGAAIQAGATLIQTAVEASTQAASDEGDAESDAQTMKSQYGNGISTSINIENATGADLILIATQDYHGHIWQYPVPPRIGAGQTGVTLHVHSSGAATGSEGAFVYRFEDPEGAQRDVFLGFMSPYSGSNTVYVEVQPAGHWPSVGSWSYMQYLIEDKGGSSSTFGQFGSTAIGSIGQSSSSVAVFNVGYSNSQQSTAKRLEEAALRRSSREYRTGPSASRRRSCPTK